MATANVKRPTSGTHSAHGGKFQFIVSASYSTSAITLTCKVKVTDALDKKYTAKFTCNGTTKSKEFKSKDTHTVGSIQIKAQKAPKITLKYAGWETSIPANTFVNDAKKPASPSKITATRVNDAEYSIVVEGVGYTGIPSHKIEIERCKDIFDKNNFSAIPSSPFTVANPSGSYVVSATDNGSDVDRGGRYWHRARAVNIVSENEQYSGWIYSDGASGGDYTSPVNDPVSSGVVAVRVSNNEVSLSWGIGTVQSVNQGLVSGFDVYRSTDGGAYSKIGSVSADTAHTQYSYTDKACSADHAYTYRIKVLGGGGEAETFTEESNEIVMTPCRPQSISAAHSSGGDVIVTISNSSNTATQICIERRIDGGSWVQIAEEDYTEGTFKYTDESAVAENTIEYRARNKNDQLTGVSAYSEYVTSSSVNEKSAPNPPTLKTPVSGSRIVLDEGTVRMVWQHNSTDGSSQELAQLRYKKNSGSWTTVDFTNESYYSLSIVSGYSAGDVVTWQVRTRGAYTSGANAGYSEWSAESTFKILTRPEIKFTEPDNGEEIETLPVNLAWTYSDLSGNLQSLKVDIKKNGKLQKSFDVPVGDGTSGSYSYSLSKFLFENDTQYGITAVALSTSGFTATDDIAIDIAYEEVSLDGGLIPVVTFNEDGIATVIIERDLTPEEGETDPPDPIEMAEVYLYRLHDRERALVAGGLDEGVQVIDKYAPINVTFEYELLMLTADGEVSIVTVEGYQNSPYWYVYWGEENIARAKWNPNGAVSLGRPEKTRVRYSGRKYPVTYDTEAIEESYSFSTIIPFEDREELENFKQMVRDGGTGIWKSGNGEVYDADFEFSYKSDFKGTQKVYDCSLDVKRKDGDL